MNSFSNYLERWRQEPEIKRKRRAFILATTLTVILFVLWLGSFRLGVSLRANPTSGESAAVTNSVPESGIIARIKAGWQAITQ